MSDQFSPDDATLFERVLRARRDVRGHSFSDRPVSSADIDRIIDAGLSAPSVGFSQPWRFVVIRDDAVKTRIHTSYSAENALASEKFEGKKGEKYRQLKLEGIMEAPVNIAVFYVPPHEPVLGQNSMVDMGRYSVVCAIQNMWLMARAMNIGMGWVSIIEPKKVRQILNARDDHELIGYLCFGHVDDFYDKPELELKGWDVRKDKDGLVFDERF